jgi:hypothetical protein
MLTGYDAEANAASSPNVTNPFAGPATAPPSALRDGRILAGMSGALWCELDRSAAP